VGQAGLGIPSGVGRQGWGSPLDKGRAREESHPGEVAGGHVNWSGTLTIGLPSFLRDHREDPGLFISCGEWDLRGIRMTEMYFQSAQSSTTPRAGRSQPLTDH